MGGGGGAGSHLSRGEFAGEVGEVQNMSCREGRVLVNRINFLVFPKNFRNKFRDSDCLGVAMATQPGFVAHRTSCYISIYSPKPSESRHFKSVRLREVSAYGRLKM